MSANPTSNLDRNLFTDIGAGITGFIAVYGLYDVVVFAAHLGVVFVAYIAFVFAVCGIGFWCLCQESSEPSAPDNSYWGRSLSALYGGLMTTSVVSVSVMFSIGTLYAAFDVTLKVASFVATRLLPVA